MSKDQFQQFLEAFQKINEHLALLVADRKVPRVVDTVCEETGEVSTQYNLQARTRIGEEPDPFQYQDPTPIAEPLVPPMSLDQILSKFGYPDPVSDSGEDDILDDEDDSDDDFNAQMMHMPYAEREDGLTEMEYAMKLSQDDVNDFRDWQANRDNPAFQKFLSLTPEEQSAMFASLDNAKIPDPVPEPDPSE